MDASFESSTFKQGCMSEMPNAMLESFDALINNIMKPAPSENLKGIMYIAFCAGNLYGAEMMRGNIKAQLERKVPQGIREEHSEMIVSACKDIFKHYASMLAS